MSLDFSSEVCSANIFLYKRSYSWYSSIVMSGSFCVSLLSGLYIDHLLNMP